MTWFGKIREFEDKLNEKIRRSKSIMPIDKYIDLFHNVSAKAAIACFDFRKKIRMLQIQLQ